MLIFAASAFLGLASAQDQEFAVGDAGNQIGINNYSTNLGGSSLVQMNDNQVIFCTDDYSGNYYTAARVLTYADDTLAVSSFKYLQGPGGNKRYAKCAGTRLTETTALLCYNNRYSSEGGGDPASPTACFVGTLAGNDMNLGERTNFSKDTYEERVDTESMSLFTAGPAENKVAQCYTVGEHGANRQSRCAVVSVAGDTITRATGLEIDSENTRDHYCVTTGDGRVLFCRGVGWESAKCSVLTVDDSLALALASTQEMTGGSTGQNVVALDGASKFLRCTGDQTSHPATSYGCMTVTVGDDNSITEGPRVEVASGKSIIWSTYGGLTVFNAGNAMVCLGMSSNAQVECYPLSISGDDITVGNVFEPANAKVSTRTMTMGDGKLLVVQGGTSSEKLRARVYGATIPPAPPAVECPVELVNARKLKTTTKKKAGKQNISGADNVADLACRCETFCLGNVDQGATFYLVTKIKNNGREGKCTCLKGNFKKRKKNKGAKIGAAGGLSEDTRGQM